VKVKSCPRSQPTSSSSPRTARALVRGGYRCLGDVQAAGDAELLALRNFGERSLAEVRAVGR
jgi:Bacterial RNA polymerase, alpha chain C terminal domain